MTLGQVSEFIGLMMIPLVITDLIAISVYKKNKTVKGVVLPILIVTLVFTAILWSANIIAPLLSGIIVFFMAFLESKIGGKTIWKSPMKILLMVVAVLVLAGLAILAFTPSAGK